MRTLPLPDIASARLHATAPNVQVSAPLFSTQRFVMVLLVLVYWKVSGIRIWPHAYMGLPLAPPRIVYYTEFLTSLMALAALLMCLPVLWRSTQRQWGITAMFMAYALVAGQFVPLPAVSAFLGVSGYVDAIVSLTAAVGLLGAPATLRLLAQTSCVFVLVNIASAAVPSVSMMIGPFAGKFRGLTFHRNDLAQLAYFCAFIALAARDLVPRRMVWTTVLGSTALVAAAQSVQGILLLPAGALMLLFAHRVRMLRHPVLLSSAAFMLLLGAFVWEEFGSIDNLLAYFGRDATFSGRDRIWALSLYLLERMPFGGYGPGRIGSEILSSGLLQSFGLGTLFSSAHNSYLEAYLAYGWVGGTLFMLSVLLGLVWSVRALLHRVDAETALAATLVVISLFGGATASEKLFLPTLGWFGFMLALALAEQRQPPSAA